MKFTPLHTARALNTNGVLMSEVVPDRAVSKDISAEGDSLFERVANSTSDLIIVAGLDGVASYISPACMQMTGYSPEELRGSLGLDMVHPNDRSRLIGQLRRLVDGESCTPTYRILRKDGVYVWIKSTIDLLVDRVPGMPREVVAISRDVMARKWAEERSDVMECSSSPMIMIGSDSLISLVNTQAERLLGYGRQELFGKPAEILVPKRLRANESGQPGIFCPEPGATATASRELFCQCRDGKEVPVEIGLSYISSHDEQYVVASIVDITERKRAQELLGKSLVEKTMLLKEVHHRVKNNLQVICSLLSMQIECAGKLSSPPLEDARSRVLAMSLIHEKVYQSETLADLDFGEYIELLGNRLFSAYCVDPSHIRLDLSVEQIHLGIEEAIPCGLILNELLSNSLKHGFSGNRGGNIRITLRRIDNGRVELAVTDNGVGLPAGFRLEDSQSLGLQVVSALIRQLRADLSVTGEGGAGFRFSWQPHETTDLPQAVPAYA